MAYLGKTPSQAVRSRYYFTASGGETSLAPAQVTGLSFTDANYVDVSLNGVALVSGTDYTATPSTNTISGLAALTASDVVEIVVYDTFSVFGGSVNGDFTISNGTLAAEAVTVTGLTTTGNINFGDNDKAIFGAGSDLQIYHDGTNSFIDDAGTGNLLIRSNRTIIQKYTGEVAGDFVADGEAALYYDNSKKIATTATGIDVTGTVTADGLTVNTGTTDIATRFESTDGTAGIALSDNAGSIGIFTRDTGDFSINVGGDASSSASNASEAIRILSDRKVGIGTSAPSKELHVKGDIDIEGDTGGVAVLRFKAEETHGTVEGINIGNNFGGLAFKTNNNGTTAERMRIDNAGLVGIGTTSPTIASSGGGVHIQNGTQAALRLDHYLNGGFEIQSASSTLNFYSTAVSAERMRIDSSGNVGIGTSSPASAAGKALVVHDTSSPRIRLTSDTTGQAATDGAEISLLSSAFVIENRESSDTIFFNAGSERMRIDSSGQIFFGTTDASMYNNSGAGNGGVTINAANGFSKGLIACARDNAQPLEVNRLASDGTLVSFSQDGTQEGTISVSGSTVSYNGGHLSRWSQATDGNRIDGLVKGTVMTNLDQMAVWHHEAQPATYYEEGDELPEGISVGDEKTPAVAAYDEDNEQLNCMAVSSVEGDANVAGVFVNWDDDDTDFTADMNIAMTGDMVIRIAQGTTVARGDLLMSAGDGTAKPQGDDIVRSKTIAKVTSTTVSHTYDDGTYLVPCVLMAC